VAVQTLPQQFFLAGPANMSERPLLSAVPNSASRRSFFIRDRSQKSLLKTLKQGIKLLKDLVDIIAGACGVGFVRRWVGPCVPFKID